MSKINVRKLQLYQLQAFKEVDIICRRNNIKYFMIGGTLLGAIRHNGFIPWDTDLDIAMYRDDYNRFIECCKYDLSDKYFLQNYKTDIDYYPSLTRICINNTYCEYKISKHLRHHKGIYIDIFPLDNVSNSKTERNSQKSILTIIDKIKLLKACYIHDGGLLNWRNFVKYSLKFLLLPISLTWLQNIREKIMTQFSDTETKYVCSTASHYGYDKQVMDRSIYGNPVLIQFENGMYYAPEKTEEYLTKIYGDYMTLPPVEERVTLERAYERIIFECNLEERN